MAGKNFGFTQQAARRISSMVRRVEAMPALRVPGGGLSGYDLPAFDPFRNDAGVTIPPYGVIYSDGWTDIDDYECFKAKRLGTSRMPLLFAVNGPNEVESNKLGGASLSDWSWALFDTADDPAEGEMWGPKNGQFKLYKGYYGFLVTDRIRERDDGDIVYCKRVPVRELIVKTNAAHDVDDTGVCTIYGGPTKGSETSMGITIDAWNRYADLATGKWAQAQHVGTGYDLVAGQC
jgi:hypothetical protein